MSGYKVSLDYSFTFESASTWGTEVDTLPLGIPTEEMTFTLEPNAFRVPRAWGYRGNHTSLMWQETSSAIPTANVKTIMTPKIVSYLLPGVLQSTGSYVSASGVWTLHTKNFAELPSPKATNQGYFYTLVRNSPSASDDEVLVSAIPSDVKLTVHPTDDNGILMGEFNFIGKGYLRAQAQTGTVTHLSTANMYKWGSIYTASFGTTVFTDDFVSLELNCSNNAKLVSEIPDGEVVFPRWDVNGTIKILAGTGTEALKEKCLNRDVNNAELLKVVWGNAGATPATVADLQLISACYLTNWNSDYTEGEVIEFNFEGCFSGSNYPLQVKNYFHSE